MSRTRDQVQDSNGKLNIVIIGNHFGFPNGMAATNRTRLLARALVESGDRVTVFCTRFSERPPIIENTLISGIYNGIRFEYTCGTTVRPKSLLRRRIIEVRGLVIALYRVFRIRRTQKLDILYLYFSLFGMTPDRWVILFFAKILKIPVVIEVGERPWSLKPSKSFFEKVLSPIYGVDGAVVISAFLEDWVRAESKRLHKEIKMLKVPILVDLEEESFMSAPSITPTVLFAGSEAYKTTVMFIIEAMHHVWNHYPECKLVLLGFDDRDPSSKWTFSEIIRPSVNGRIEWKGYIPRPQLLNAYREAWLLLIPLFDDVRSTARFPTKIGEYLASSRPIVTNYVGEIDHYLVDGVSAYICEPGNSKVYGERIIDALRLREESDRIGKTGRKVAEKEFDYSIYGRKLHTFFVSVVG